MSNETPLSYHEDQRPTLDPYKEFIDIVGDSAFGDDVRKKEDGKDFSTSGFNAYDVYSQLFG